MTPTDLRLYRSTHNLTQTQLAQALGVSRGTVASWEAGTYRIPAMASLALAYLAQENFSDLR